MLRTCTVFQKIGTNLEIYTFWLYQIITCFLTHHYAYRQMRDVVIICIVGNELTGLSPHWTLISCNEHEALFSLQCHGAHYNTGTVVY